jgi:hypothetical protein
VCGFKIQFDLAPIGGREMIIDVVGLAFVDLRTGIEKG